jgi:hypothetical protein
VRTSDGFDRKAFGLEFEKRATVMFSGLQKVRTWTVCRDRPPPKRENMNWIPCMGRPPPKRKNLLALLAQELEMQEYPTLWIVSPPQLE